MLSGPIPDDVYLDTSFVVNAVFQVLPGSISCIEATDEIRDNQSIVYTSELLRLEYAQALRRLATRRRLPRHLHKRHELDRWAIGSVRYQWLVYGFSELDKYLGTLPIVYELPYDNALMIPTTRFMAEYALGSLDAIHLATALHYEIPVFWTCDDHFQRADDLHIEIIR